MGSRGAYIAVGQDEAGYRSRYLAASSRAAWEGFNDYLAANAVGGVLPTWQLLLRRPLA
jgi:hypothetical protein